MKLLLFHERAGHRRWVSLITLLMLVYSAVNVCAATTVPGTPADPAGIANTCTPPGADATVSGVLSCTNTTVTLNGASSTAGVTFSWSGPQGFASMLQNPVISLPGLYTLTVTSPGGDCTSTDNVTVEQNVSLPGAQASVLEMLNCSTPSVTLHATTQITGATFRWIGPNGYISTQQNPSITVPGGYTLNVTNPLNGCTSTSTVTVEQSIDLPGVSVGAPETLTCSTTEVLLTASSPLAEAEFTWTGPSGFTGDGDIVSISTSGTYTVTAKNLENTCTSVKSVTVLENTNTPGASASASSEITCNTTAVTLSASSSATDVTYRWTGPGNFSSIAQHPVVSRAGTYTLTVTKASNGCVSSTTTSVVQNNSGPGADASVSGPITCSNAAVTLLGTSQTSPVTYRWLGPNSFVSTDQNPTTTRAGGYTLTVTSTSTGCTTNDVIVVSQDVAAPLGVAATVSGPLTCSVSSVTLSGTSTTSGVEYSWSGPNGFTSTQQNPSVSVAGPYVLTVKRTASACTATATVTVLQNNTVPVATASVSGTLTCTRTSVTLTVTTTPSPTGLTYAWTGPNGFTSTLKSPVVSAAGNYQVTVTDPANSCTSSSQVTILEDKDAPGVTASVLGTLTCNVSSVTLVATPGITTSGLLFSWSGPAGYSSTEQNAVTTVAGGYTVVATNPTNGCFSTASVTVLQNTSAPADVVAEGGTLSCLDGSVILQVSSTTSGVTYRWTGPNDYVSTSQGPEVDVPGLYKVRVTNPSNACFFETTVTVGEDFEAPEGVAASPSTDLSCKTSSVTLTGTSLTEGVTYSWTGPQGFTSSSASPAVTVAGTYELKVTNPVNGCFATTSTLVSENKTLPNNVDATVSGPLNCSTSSVTLHGISSTNDVTYHWTGPNGFVSEEQNPVTSIEGDYTLTVTHPVSGCVVTDAVTVQRNASLPENVDATAPATLLTCTTPVITLTAASSTASVTYQWVGPDNFSSTSSAPAITVPGDYTLSVTHPLSGCTDSDVITIQKDVTVPQNVTATNSGILTCSITSVELRGESTTSGVTYSWTGPESFTSTLATPSVSVSGIYALVVTHSVSGCTATGSTTVEKNTTKPVGNVSNTTGPTTLTCYVSPLTFTGTTTATGTLQWTGPNGFLLTSSTSPLPVNVTVPGTYSFTVIGANGCVSDAKTRNIIANYIPPTVTATPSGDITCNDASVTLTGASTGSNITYNWTGPNGFTSNLQNPEVTVGGDYTLTVSTPGKCTASSTTTVVEDKAAPGNVSADVSGPLSCDMPMVTLLGSSSTSDVTYAWSSDNGFTSTEQNPSTTLEGTYTLTVTNSATGCFDTDAVTVLDECTTARTATASSVSAEVEREGTELSVYPNPVKDIASIEFTAPAKGYARLEIYSLLNVKIATLFDGETEPGINTVKFDTNDYSSGVYVYRLVYSGGQREGRLIVTH